MDTWGIADGYWDVAGEWNACHPDVRAALAAAMGAEGDAPPATYYWSVTQGDAHYLQSVCTVRLEDGTHLPSVGQLPPDLPIGYHQLLPDDGGPITRLVVAPARCPDPPAGWGWSTQLYALRSRWSWGTGDLGDLAGLVAWTAAVGGKAVLVNPLHATAPVVPQQPSPYYPSSRRFRNVLYLRIADVPGATLVGSELAPLDAAGRALNASKRLQRDAAMALKLDALARIFAALGPDAGGEPFRSWRARRETELARWATYCSLAEQHGANWATWPPELRHPDAPGVAAHAEVAAERIRFHAWCQWLLDVQFDRVGRPGVAVLQDLAVGFDPGGYDAWCDQDLLALSCRIGAPPDELGPEGQDWGLPPYIPWKLRAAGFEPFVAAVRAALSHAGGLRIDHVMGLFRQFWIPAGATAERGGYVRFPAPELLDIVAVEASRQGAFVIGEDLGTVEPEVRHELRSRGILGTTLGWFEDVPPAAYEPATLTALTTHDLPTAAGVKTGADSAAVRRLGRRFDGTRIRARLEEVLAPGEVTVPGAIVAAHRTLATSPALLVLAQVDDALCAINRPNLPGTVDQWPNWSLPLPGGLEELTTHPTALAVARALADGRAQALARRTNGSEPRPEPTPATAQEGTSSDHRSAGEAPSH